MPSFGSDIDPDVQPMKQASTSGGVEFQMGNNAVLTAHYIHNDLLETIRTSASSTPKATRAT